MSTSIGKILITPKGDFVDNTTYEILDVVLYNGSSYISKINNNTLPVDDTDGWQLFALGGDMATGTTDYEDLTNKPSIDGVELTGDIVGGDTINTSFNNISDTLNNTFVSVQQYVDDSLGDQFIVEFVETV